MPFGFTPPITSKSSPPFPSARAEVTAPLVARMPHAILTPSNAGPAAVLATTILLPSVTMTSPLVPRSNRGQRLALRGEAEVDEARERVRTDKSADERGEPHIDFAIEELGVRLPGRACSRLERQADQGIHGQARKRDGAWRCCPPPPRV